MPPLPDEENTGSGEDIPFSAPAKGGAADGEDDGNESEEEYVIEAIISHIFTDGEVKYEVKWEGYENPEDNTFESEENLESAPDVLHQYWKKIGGKPEPKPKGRKRKANDELKVVKAKRGRSETPEQGLTSRRKSGTKGQDFKPPKGSWEKDVASIDTIEEFPDEKGQLQRYAYVLWNSGEKTRHQLRTVNEKCPQRMLAYYESHLVFRTAAEPADNEF